MKSLVENGKDPENIAKIMDVSLDVLDPTSNIEMLIDIA